MSPTNALSARVMLATGLHAQPGVYALLLGSGVSRSAGISTGWEIVSHLVQKAAAAGDPEDTQSRELAKSDPEAWWAHRGQGDLGYSSLLAAVAPSSAARQGLLAEYFVATDEDRAEGLKVPTAGHRAIAELVKGGWIKVILTTNFDRLMEQALDAVGVGYQVIARPDAATGSTPIAHATATIVKLHGDWSDLEFRNTVDELESYPKPWVDVLRQVFNEYGLLISGWSAEWDKALVRVLEATPRRYPLYWDSRSSNTDVARNLLAQRGGHVIATESADELFTSMQASVDALTRLAEPPLTTAMAVARLKRALPDPIRRIELRDLISGAIKTAFALLKESKPTDARNFQVIDAYLDAMHSALKPLLTLLVNGVRYDDGTHTKLWVDALQSMLDRPRLQPNQLVQTVDELWQYPSLLVLRAMSIEAVAQGNDALLVRLLTVPRWHDVFNPGRSPLAADVLHTHTVLNSEIVNQLPRWKNNGWLYPNSHLLKTVLAELFTDSGVDEVQYKTLCDDVEYQTGLVQFLLPSIEGEYRHNADSGEFVIEQRWSGRNETLLSEQRFLRHYANEDTQAAWSELLEPKSASDVLRDYRELLKGYVKYF